jgi:hypothetical protein
MTGRRTIVGLWMLCALALSAFAAQSASATTKGTTAFTCKKTGAGGGFTKSHCKPADAGSGEYSHVAVAENTTTEIKGTNQNTAAETTKATNLILKVTVGGVELELQATGLAGEGWTENRKDPGTGEHYLVDAGMTQFTGVTVQKPAGKGCKVYTDNEGVKGAEGVVDTAQLSVTSKGQGDFLKFEPTEGSTFARFIFDGCSPAVPACEGTWEVTGSLKGVPEGATVRFSHTEVTTQNTLKGKGSKAGLEGTVAISSRMDNTETYTPLSVTTVETP